jgi:hypothetical protein
MEYKIFNLPGWFLTLQTGRAIAQARSRWFPTAAARVRSQVRSCGICGGQSGTGAGFFRVLRFLLPILIPPTAPQSSSSIIRGWYSRPTMADVPSGLSLTPPRETKKKRKLTKLTLQRIQFQVQITAEISIRYCNIHLYANIPTIVLFVKTGLSPICF